MIGEKPRCMGAPVALPGGAGGGAGRVARRTSSRGSSASAVFRARAELKIARWGSGLWYELGALATRGSAPKCDGIKISARATNASEPAVSPTHGAQRHSKKSVTN
jgi:hypothetical protein